MPPFHSEETTQDNSINQIMERSDSMNEYSQEILKLESMINQVADMVEKIGKNTTDIRSIVDVMDQMGIMLSAECRELSDIRKQVGNDIVKLAHAPVPISIPDDVRLGIKMMFANCSNEMKTELNSILYEYIQSLQKRNEEFVSKLSRNKGVWLSSKVFWWAFGITYILSLAGFGIVVWNLTH